MRRVVKSGPNEFTTRPPYAHDAGPKTAAGKVRAAHPCASYTRISQTPHPTLHGLKDELPARGVKVSHNAVWMFLRHEGLRFKKNTVRH